MGFHFVGAGISGGEVGALEGPSIMPGGSKESYEALGPILEKISAHVGDEPCATYIGTDGAGHSWQPASAADAVSSVASA